MRRILAVAVVLVAAGLSWSTPASACSVTEPVPTEAQYVAMADVVFEGVALGRQQTGGTAAGTGYDFAWTFSVDRPVKGSVALQQVVETSATSSCGIPFAVGTRYRVFANYDGAVLRTGLGSGTQEAPLVATTTTTVPRPVPPASPGRRIALTG